MTTDATIKRPFPEDDHLTTAEAAEFIGVKPGTLNDWRSAQREGQPPFVKYGHRVWYRRKALADWMEQQAVTF